MEEEIEISAPRGIVNLLSEYDPTAEEIWERILQRKIDSEVQGERKLMLRLLDSAIEDFRKYLTAKSWSGKTLFSNAEEWISQKGSDYIYSFEYICETFKIDPGYLRGGLMELKEMKLVKDSKTYHHS